MVSENQGGTNRRRFLQSGGVVALGAIAGCSSDGGSGGSGGGSGSGGSGGSDGSGSGGSGGSTTTAPQTTTAQEAWSPPGSVTMIIPYGPGGGYDFYSRLLAAVLQEDFLDVQVNAQNVEGAGGISGMNQIYNAEPDGRTMGIMNTESFALSQLAQQDAVRYDMRETTYYPRIAGTTQTIAVSTETDITTIEQLIEESLAGNIKYANTGPTSNQAIVIKALAALGGIEDYTLEHYDQNAVTFDGRGEQLTAMRRGDIQVMTSSFSSLLPFQESGDIRFILIYSMEDSVPEDVENPDCETFATTDLEIQNKDQIVALPGGPFHRLYVGPKDIPDDIHQFWCDTITEAIESDRFQQRAQESDRPILYGDCETSRKGAIGTLETYQNNLDLLRELGFEV